MPSEAKQAVNRRVLSGMRPTGKLHIGHYVGALQNWIRLQNDYDCFFFVADWHALTTDYADTSRVKRQHPRDGLRLARRRARSREGNHLHPVARAPARRTSPPAFHDDSAGLAGARPDLQGAERKSEGEGSQHLRIPRLSRAQSTADILMYQALLRSRGRGSGCARRDHSRDRAQVQPVLQTSDSKPMPDANEP